MRSRAFSLLLLFYCVAAFFWLAGPIHAQQSDPDDIYWDGRFGTLGVEGTIFASASSGDLLFLGGRFNTTAQLATSNIVTLILAANQGIGFQIVTGGAGVGTGVPNEMCALMARKGSGLGSGASFAGRRVAVNTRNNINWLALRMFVDGRGGHSDRVNILEIPFPQMADALLNDRVDAATINEPYATAAMEAGETP